MYKKEYSVFFHLLVEKKLRAFQICSFCAKKINFSVAFWYLGCYILRNYKKSLWRNLSHMKKIMIILAVLMAAVLLTSCTTTADDIEGTGVELSVNKPEIIDYKGQAFGSNIPGWVLDASDGNNKAVAKALGLDDKKVWILQNDGQDLDMLKLWTDQIDGRSQIASGIEQTIADLITAEMNATEADKATKQQMVDEFSSRVTNLTLQGLEKETDYWTKTRTLKTGVKAKNATEADYTYKYTYLVVFCMDEDLYAKQIDEAFADVGNNDDQSAMLREVVTAQLKEKLTTFAAD